MKAFLQRVADVYVSRHAADLFRMCFIFPNKRSGLFFEDYLTAALKGTYMLMPEVTNITDFTASISNLSEATRFDMLFTLFDQYRKIFGDEVEFDKFVFWADMLIGDFNDVDRYMVDARALFVNVKRLREISANYLTSEQKELLKRYWGDDCFDKVGYDDGDRFWNHLTEDESDTQKRFFKLWEALAPMYQGYTDSLSAKGLASPGRLSRLAAEALNPRHGGDFVPNHTRYVFVGFNVLSTAEIEIFTRLQQRDLADFYWDCNSPMLNIEYNQAARFVKCNMRMFPSRYDIGEKPFTTLPDITIKGVPSAVGQVKIVNATLRQMIESKQIADPSNAIDTAVVFPNESLLIPMLHSLPEALASINVTMGFPMRYNPLASLFHLIITLRLHERGAAGESTFYYEDVEAIVSSPAISTLAHEQADNLMDTIRRDRLFNVPFGVIAKLAPRLMPIFIPIAYSPDNSGILNYLMGICTMLKEVRGSDGIALHSRFIDAYEDAINELYDAACEYRVEMEPQAFFRLVERALSTSAIRFKGEPLKGLQLMGVLETRALDFDNVIMLSLNERIFPRKHYTRSFISDALRRDFGMATLDFQESIYAYYFYRLLSRAKRATLIYDSRTVGGLRNNEMSRYLLQLLYIGGRDNMLHTTANFSTQAFDKYPIKVDKTPDVKAKLMGFCNDDGFRLSASTINHYIECKLKFYLSSVESYREEEELTDYMDSSTYGTVVHDTMQQIYESMQGPDHKPVTVQKPMIEALLKKGNLTVEKMLRANINRLYLRKKETEYDAPLEGEALIHSEVMYTSIMNMLRYDLTLCPFEFVAAEYKVDGKLRVNDRLTVNFTQRIDRIDRVNGRLRFIDYKTGTDPLSAKSISDAFTLRKNRPKAMLQLILYSHFYNMQRGVDEPIQPMIYSVNDISLNGEALPLNIAGEELTDYHQALEEFIPLLDETLSELFLSDTPFTQAEDEEYCKFCQFKELCERNTN